jgi:nucleoid DNA-binding protein
MDIAKYVGLFLIKNEYCFLPGIGSLQIEKKAAVYDKEAQKMTAPSYQVMYRQAGGSIDDSFANFIANNERISIAHAANHLKDFCAGAKVDLKEGREVIIPSIGKFLLGANGNIQFATDPHLHIEGKAVPFFRNSVSVDQKKEEAISNIIEKTTIREPKADEEIVLQAPQVNWGKIALLAIIALVVIGGAIFLFWFMNRPKADESPVVPVTETVAPAQESTAPAPTTDTASAPAGTPVSAATDGTITYKVALHQYPYRERAESRVAKLKSYGNNSVSLLVKDSTAYYVVMPMTSAAADTTRVVDSLRKLFNPSGKVEILH